MSINVTKDPRWEEPCRRRAHQQKGSETKGKCGKHRQSRMLEPKELRMSLTGVNEEAGWFPHLPLFPTHTSLLITQPHFFFRAAADNSRRVTCWSVTGSTFCHEYVWKDGEKPLPALCLRLSKWTLTLLAWMWDFGIKAIAGISVCERFQAWEVCRNGEDAFYKGDMKTLKQEADPIMNKRCAFFQDVYQKKQELWSFSLLQQLFLQTRVSLGP